MVVLRAPLILNFTGGSYSIVAQLSTRRVNRLVLVCEPVFDVALHKAVESAQVKQDATVVELGKFDLHFTHLVDLKQFQLGAQLYLVED